MTTNRGNYWQCREQCLDMGGDLLYHSFGKEGKHYHKFVLNLINCSLNNINQDAMKF